MASIAAAARPVVMRVPTKLDKSGWFWLGTRHIVSIYIADKTVYIERTRTTSGLVYSSEQEAKQAAELFAEAMEVKPSEGQYARYPQPVDGTIRVHATEISRVTDDY
jgi:hypothetical protein